MDLFMSHIAMKHLCNQIWCGLSQTFQQNSVWFYTNQWGGRCSLHCLLQCLLSQWCTFVKTSIFRLLQCGRALFFSFEEWTAGLQRVNNLMQKNFSRTKGENLVLGLLWFGLSSLCFAWATEMWWVSSKNKISSLSLTLGSKNCRQYWIKTCYLSLILSSRTSYTCCN